MGSRLALVGAALLALGCGGKSAQDAGSGAASSGGGGASGGGGGGAPARCVEGEARCNAAGQREVCGADQQWATSDFVCATNVAVDDEIGSYCVTKADGSFRCWGGETTDQLPVERYRRVQLTRTGLIGLTDDGRLHVPASISLTELPPIATFRATNMYGGWGVCPLFADGSFHIYLERHDLDGPRTEVIPVDGTFTRAFCAFEGLGGGVRTDGSLWTQHGEAPPGNDFTDVAVSVRILCALTELGAVVCKEGAFPCESSASGNCSGGANWTFPSGRYHSITATYAAVCAIDEQGTLVCERYDGVPMPVAGGPYTFAEAGKDVLCALRVDGSTACFRHGDGLGSADSIGSFVPIDPAIDPGW